MINDYRIAATACFEGIENAPAIVQQALATAALPGVAGLLAGLGVTGGEAANPEGGVITPGMNGGATKLIV